MQEGRIPTFSLNKLVKIRYFLVLAQNLSLEMRFSKRFSERALRKYTKLVLAFHLFDLGGATVHHSSSFFNGYQLWFMPFGQIPTFALNKPVKIRYFLVLTQNLSLEMRNSKTFKNEYFLHLMTQLLSIQKFFPNSTHQVKKLGSSG